jgi:hypothetical protein
VRNGTRPKTVLTESTGQVRADVPRDRQGTFEPKIGPTGSRGNACRLRRGRLFCVCVLAWLVAGACAQQGEPARLCRGLVLVLAGHG